MAFVDGENFTIRGQKVAVTNGLQLAEGDWYKKDCFLWIPGWRGHQRVYSGYMTIQQCAVRASYYTSVSGDDQAVAAVKDRLWQIGFTPQVFKKGKQDQKAKGVDIALTKDMLSHAFLANYQVAVLVAGDGDYVPLVEEIKRLGKRVYLLFFADEGLSPTLKLAVDEFYDLTPRFLDEWRKFIAQIQGSKP